MPGCGAYAFRTGAPIIGGRGAEPPVHRANTTMRFTLLTILALTCLSASSRPTLDSYAADEFRFVPVRVHLLRSHIAPAADTRLMASDVERIFRKGNGIWLAAGIRLWVESVVVEDAANSEARRDDLALTLDTLAALRPRGSRADAMFHVYFVRSMSVNGVYMARDNVFVQDSARLEPVPGGIDEPLPRVTSHELGHALGLAHRQARTNLMASGTTGTSLNAEEIETARHTAYSLPWIVPAEDFLKQAETLLAEGHRDSAVARFKAIAELPGHSSLIDRARSALSAQANKP
jgi:hypothetical protein